MCQEKTCQENGVLREGSVKRRRSQEKEMPKDRDAKRKRRQRTAAEKTWVSRDSHDIRKALSEAKGVRPRASWTHEGLSKFRDAIETIVARLQGLYLYPH